jgi:glycosyltransferase involved in cell wall biosynthesis
MDAQGPRSPSLVTAVANESERFDLILYFTYLYYPTYFGIKRTAHKAVLHPTAHDEPTFYLSMFKHMFHSSAGFVFLSPEERRLVIDQFDLHDPMNVVVGSGMEKPLAVPRESFREAFDIRSPYLLCLGRQERAKGSHYLCEWFANFKLKHPSDLKLVLAGSGNYRPPSNPSIIQVGPLSESLKWTALEDAEVLIQPSFHESLSLVVLEAWAASTPVMVNGWCDVTRGLCSRSQGGVWYRNYLEFETALDALMEDRDLRDGLAAGGMRHVAVHCAWDGVMERYVSFLRDVADHV